MWHYFKNIQIIIVNWIIKELESETISWWVYIVTFFECWLTFVWVKKGMRDYVREMAIVNSSMKVNLYGNYKHVIVPSNMKSHRYKHPSPCFVLFLKDLLYRSCVFEWVCVCPIHRVQVSFTTPFQKKPGQSNVGGSHSSQSSARPLLMRTFSDESNSVKWTGTRPQTFTIRAPIECLTLVIHKGFAS